MSSRVREQSRSHSSNYSRTQLRSRSRSPSSRQADPHYISSYTRYDSRNSNRGREHSRRGEDRRHNNREYDSDERQYSRYNDRRKRESRDDSRDRLNSKKSNHSHHKYDDRLSDKTSDVDLNRIPTQDSSDNGKNRNGTPPLFATSETQSPVDYRQQRIEAAERASSRQSSFESSRYEGNRTYGDKSRRNDFSSGGRVSRFDRGNQTERNNQMDSHRSTGISTSSANTFDPSTFWGEDSGSDSESTAIYATYRQKNRDEKRKKEEDELKRLSFLSNKDVIVENALMDTNQLPTSRSTSRVRASSPVKSSHKIQSSRKRSRAENSDSSSASDSSSDSDSAPSHVTRKKRRSSRRSSSSSSSSRSRSRSRSRSSSRDRRSRKKSSYKRDKRDKRDKKDKKDTKDKTSRKYKESRVDSERKYKKEDQDRRDGKRDKDKKDKKDSKTYRKTKTSLRSRSRSISSPRSSSPSSSPPHSISTPSSLLTARKDQKKDIADSLWTGSISTSSTVMDEKNIGNTEESSEDEFGPAPAIGMGDFPKNAQNAYGGSLRPGEGSAMAGFVQAGQRIPRRGEIGMTSVEIEKFEKSGFVMSGSRHQRMNAVRIRKENQIYTAEEQRAMMMLNLEEKLAQERKNQSELQKLLQVATEGLESNNSK